MSNICIFGAGGRTGIKVVQEALERGHVVTAFMYKQNPIVSALNVKSIIGGVLDQDSVQQALDGVDAVISVIGHTKDSDPFMQTKGMKNIVRAMKSYGITRIVSLTGTGVRQENDHVSCIDMLANFFVKLFDADRVKDGIQHVQVLQNSELNWTVLRVLKLSQMNFNNEYYLTEHGPVEYVTSRDKVAKALVSLVSSHDFIHKMPIMSQQSDRV